ncbi:amino acid permease [Imleria badia]|nr:amino acid permease [Imleria badia]
MASDRGSSDTRQLFHNGVVSFEVEDQAPAPEVHTALQRKLKNRHVAMISIGGVIGTGLFLGTAPSLMHGGPLGLLLVYVFMGTICLATMLSLGEMTTFLPIPGGFIKLAERFVDPAFAFATGWNYWYQWTVRLVQPELSAAAVVVSFWDSKTNPAVWITVCLVVIIAINALGVGAYGEAEFWFCSIKVTTITGLIILGIIVDLGGSPNHNRIGFRYWKNPGPFGDYNGFTGAKGQFLGTCSITTQVMFAYIGTEAVAMAAAEARNPRRTIPKAIKKIYFRVLLFYVGGVFVIGLLVPSNNPLLNINSIQNASASPFVIAFNAAGIKVLPSIINGVILTSAWSAGSSDLYLASRSLYGLAVSGSAPKIFSRTTRAGLPHVAVGVCSCFALLAYLTIGDGPGKVFIWFSDFSTTAGLVTWFGIGVTYLRFYEGLKAQGIDRKTLPFAPRVQPFAAWWCVCGSGFSLVFSAWYVFLDGNWSTITFVTDYVPIVFFPVLYLAAKFVMRVRPVKAEKMDFVTNVAEFDAMTYDDPPPKNWLEAFWMWLM